MIFGTFDGLHPGHKFFIEESARTGDELMVVLSSDHYIRLMKKSEPLYSYSQRKNLLEECNEVKKVIRADEELGSFHVLERENPAIVCLGHDQTALKESLDHWLDSHLSFVKPKVIIIPPFRRHLYSSTIMKGLLEDT